MANATLLNDMRTALESDLQHSLAPLQNDLAQPIADMISYHLGWKQNGAEGKRVRPIYTLLCCAASGGAWEKALPAASAIEWIHNFSLIHDDIQDQSKTRRGRDTLWALEGVAQAINTGDAVFAISRITIQRLIDRGLSPQVTLNVMACLDQACLQLTVGQHLDLDFEARTSVKVAEYLEMIGRKTGALLEAACKVGSLVGDPSGNRADHFGEFGRQVGLAFQMYDDLLGIWGNSDQTGKPTGDDILSRKKTLPILYGMERSNLVRELWTHNLDQNDLLEDMLEALEASGAKSHVQQQAESFTQNALDALQRAQPLQPFGQELEELSLSLLRRVS